MVTALKCPHCSAALPTPTPGASFLQCSFCGGVAQLAMPTAVAPVAAREAQPVVPNGPTRDDLKRFVDAFTVALGAGEPFVGALQTAARGALAGFGDQTAMAFGVAHLALDFERDSGARVQHDGQVVSRLAEAWYKAANEVARGGGTEVNLPFLTATESGPKHLLRAVTAADLARMTSGPPSVAAAAPAPEPAPPEPEPKKKKKGWFW
ncbi:MAG: hypothetical protein IT370_22560 [Deltaproteobacteria bacterium]|nr:hypothetical protein [Deltaproteobacteria bacterium]